MDIPALFEADTWQELATRVAGPLLTIGLVVFLSGVVLRLGRTAIRRSVEQAANGTPGFLQRIEDRTGLDVARDQDPIRRLRKQRRATALGALASSVMTVVVWSAAVMMILDQVGVSLAPIIASAGIVGIAVGFGAQNLVKDFLTGVFILAEDQFGLGDIVDVGEATGVVEGVSLRSTRVRDVNGTLWHIPNGEIVRTGNMSQGWARTLLDVDVAYGSDIEHAQEVILATAESMAQEERWSALFLETPEMWGVERLGADGIALRLVIKVVPGEQWGISRDLRRRIKSALDAAGIEIPFPQRTVWLRHADDEEPGGGNRP